MNETGTTYMFDDGRPGEFRDVRFRLAVESVHDSNSGRRVGGVWIHVGQDQVSTEIRVRFPRPVASSRRRRLQRKRETP